MKKIIFLVTIVVCADVWAMGLEIRPGYNRKASEALFKAAINNDTEGMKRAIAAGADVNAKDWNGSTVLHEVVSENSKKLIDVLLIARADVNVRNYFGKMPLHQAVNKDSKELIDALLAAKADVNVKDNNGHTPLHYAAYKNSKKILNTLLAAGADINAKDDNGHTPLYVAVEANSVGAIKKLIEAEATMPDRFSDEKIEQLDSVIKEINEERERYNHALRGLSALEGKNGRMNLLMFERLYAPRLPLASEVYAQRQAAEAI